MAQADYSQLAADIVKEVGGVSNIASATHCATRLRLKLKDQSKASKAKVESLPHVISVVEAGGQFQVVIGDDVPLVYAEVAKIPGVPGVNGAQSADDDEVTEKGNLFDKFIALISSIFTPFLWTLAGIGLLKAFITLAVNFKWLDNSVTETGAYVSSTYAILNATADAVFYFLPIFLAITAANRFKANQFTAVAIAGALVYPSTVALNGAPDVTFMGIPVVMIGYTSSVIPILFAVWIQGYLERGLKAVLPKSLRNFTVPLVTAFVMVPLTLIVVGPLTNAAAGAVSDAVMWVFDFAPWLAGAIMGGFWQVFVMFGIHWGFVPIMMNDFATIGHSLLAGPLPAAVVAQAAAALAVVIRTRSKKRRELAAPGIFSGFFAGITEPLIYGVNLPMKLPFYFGLVGGAIGGGIAAAGNSASDAFVMPSLLALPAYMNVGSFPMQLIGVGVGIVVAFTLTLFFGVTKNNDKPDEESAASASSPAEAPVAVATAAAPVALKTGVATTLAAPVAGELVALADISDKVFASGALGAGVGVIPSENTITAPISGKVVTAFPTGHAFGIKSEDGVEVLVHIGIDTVAMKGDGFQAAVTAGQQVKAGDTLAVVDFDKVKAAGYDTTTIVVVTNTKKLTKVTPAAAGPVSAGAEAIVVEV